MQHVKLYTYNTNVLPVLSGIFHIETSESVSVLPLPLEQFFMLISVVPPESCTVHSCPDVHSEPGSS